MKNEFFINGKLLVQVIHYEPAIETKICRNPSDPEYANPGVSEELSYNLYVYAYGMQALLPIDKFESIYNALYDTILEEVENRAKSN